MMISHTESEFERVQYNNFDVEGGGSIMSVKAKYILRSAHSPRQSHRKRASCKSVKEYKAWNMIGQPCLPIPGDVHRGGCMSRL